MTSTTVPAGSDQSRASRVRAAGRAGHRLGRIAERGEEAVSQDGVTSLADVPLLSGLLEVRRSSRS
jgi:hypothetical protein